MPSSPVVVAASTRCDASPPPARCWSRPAGASVRTRRGRPEEPPGGPRRLVSQIAGRRHLTGMTSIAAPGSHGRLRVRALCLALCVVLAVAACSDDDDVATDNTLAPITTTAT